tara:strand:- start:15349 stop:16224 length:876 start_codon:yes stop_codon:yes gene_type:complete
MIDKIHINYIEKLLDNNKITFSKLLSNSFGINCLKLKSLDNKHYIVKFYEKKESQFNAIKSESKNLTYLNNLKINYFPRVLSNNEDYLIMSYIENNNITPNEIKMDLLGAIVKLHSFHNNFFGFDFDTQIGGLKQKNNKSKNWVDFYRNYRLGYIFEIINKSKPMEYSINKKIELLLKNLETYIPNNPTPSLLHGDLWAGNILFNNSRFVGLIDPGSFYGHNELEVAYLTWFNPEFIGSNFLSKYNEILKIDKEYNNYEPIYQLYYSLLNVYLWDRAYIKDVKRLLDIIIV